MTDLSPVRGAVPEDEDAILDLCYALHAENAIFSLNKDKVREVVRCAIYKETTPRIPINPTLAVIGKPGYPEAAACFTFTQTWFSDDWHLFEYFVYVDPRHRKSMHVMRLLEFVKECCRRVGTPVSIGVTSAHRNILTGFKRDSVMDKGETRIDAKLRLYRRAFGEPIGAFFVYFPPDETAASAAGKDAA